MTYDPKTEKAESLGMPMVGEGNKQRMGVFTFLLHRALMRNTAHSFRDLAQEIVADLNSDSTGGKVPPPVFDGDLDAAVPGSLGEKLPNAVAGIVSDGGIEIPAGSLRGFDVGARLAALGIEVSGSTPEALQAEVLDELAKWSKVIRNAKLFGPRPIRIPLEAD